jgi:hypothetical protein
MLTALLWLGGMLLGFGLGVAVGYSKGYADGWADAGQTGYETLVDGGWLRGGGDRGE